MEVEKTFAWKIQQFQVITGLYHFIINEQKCALIFSLLKKHITRKKPSNIFLFSCCFLFLWTWSYIDCCDLFWIMSQRVEVQVSISAGWQD